MKRWARITSLAVLLALAWTTRPALADPTQEEVFRSINQSVGSTVDMRKALPYVMATIALIILAVLYNKRRERQTLPRALNHAGKLMREIGRRIHLRSAEIKQLKVLAEEQTLEYPLTLLLCPSILGKALRSRNPRLDHDVLHQLVQRLRQDAARHRPAAAPAQNPTAASTPTAASSTAQQSKPAARP